MGETGAGRQRADAVLAPLRDPRGDAHALAQRVAARHDGTRVGLDAEREIHGDGRRRLESGNRLHGGGEIRLRVARVKTAQLAREFAESGLVAGLHHFSRIPASSIIPERSMSAVSSPWMPK